MKQTDVQRADSINQAALAEDFIIVSYVYAEPGKAIYSKAGHAMLRLQSPSNNLDICYTFAMGDDTSNILKFLSGQSEATYVYRTTPHQLQEYIAEGRCVREIQLNLAPRQEQELWRMLDEEMGRETMYRYDYVHTNCASMINRAVQYALGEEKILYHDLPEDLQGDYGLFRHKLLTLCDNSPWYKVFWNITLGDWLDHDCTLDMMLGPCYMWEEWPKATILSSDGKERPLTLGKPQVLTAGTLKYHSNPFTPNLAGSLLLCFALIITGIEWRKTRCTFLGKCFDLMLLTLHTLTSLWVLSLPFLADAGGNNWNWLMLVFNPLPLFTYALIKKYARARKLFYLYGVVPLLFVVFTPWMPQMQCFTLFLHLLFLAFAIRSIRFANQDK